MCVHSILQRNARQSEVDKEKTTQKGFTSSFPFALTDSIFWGEQDIMINNVITL